MNRFAITVFLLCCSNVFMTFAWYGHLRNHAHKPRIIAALLSWGIALFVFVPFSIFYLKEKLSLDYLSAGCCLLGAVFFLFRRQLFAA
jgi:uncharacterized protein (DUF486 family)